MRKAQLLVRTICVSLSHDTGGFDVKLFRWNLFGLLDRFDHWQLSLAGDAARLYLNTSLSNGIWH